MSATDWNSRYENKDTPWDLSGPTPEFTRLLPQLPKKGRALVPGGGRGYDAVLLAQHGLEVDLVDIAPLALIAAQENAFAAKVTVHAYLQDFFELPKLPYHRGRYDLMLEYTFFCAIDPALRESYVKAAAALLKPGGLLVGLFFPTATDKPGPPFVVSKSEVEAQFKKDFELKFEDPKESVKPRAGREFLGIFRRK